MAYRGAHGAPRSLLQVTKLPTEVCKFSLHMSATIIYANISLFMKMERHLTYESCIYFLYTGGSGAC